MGRTACDGSTVVFPVRIVGYQNGGDIIVIGAYFVLVFLFMLWFWFAKIQNLCAAFEPCNILLSYRPTPKWRLPRRRRPSHRMCARRIPTLRRYSRFANGSETVAVLPFLRFKSYKTCWRKPTKVMYGQNICMPGTRFTGCVHGRCLR